jgi:hypothetical protein
LKVGRCIIACCASNPELIKYIVTGSSRRKIEKEYNKITDFVSRLNSGSFEIPSINQISRRRDRVWIALGFLRRRFPTLCHVPAFFLQFIERLVFLNEVRSLETIVGSLPSSTVRPADVIERLIIDREIIDFFRNQLSNRVKTPLQYHLSKNMAPLMVRVRLCLFDICIASLPISKEPKPGTISSSRHCRLHLKT